MFQTSMFLSFISFIWHESTPYCRFFCVYILSIYTRVLYCIFGVSIWVHAEGSWSPPPPTSYGPVLLVALVVVVVVAVISCINSSSSSSSSSRSSRSSSN